MRGPEGGDVTALGPEKRKRIHDQFEIYDAMVKEFEQSVLRVLSAELGIKPVSVLQVWNNAYAGVAWDDEFVYVGKHRRE
jgi:hypothetical protein